MVTIYGFTGVRIRNELVDSLLQSTRQSMRYSRNRIMTSEKGVSQEFQN